MEAIQETIDLWKRLCQRSGEGQLAGHTDEDASRAWFRQVPAGYQLRGMLVDAACLDGLIRLQEAAAEKTQQFNALKAEVDKAKQDARQ